MSKDIAADRRRKAAHFRKLIEREEGPGRSYGKLPDWPEVKAMMLEYIRRCEAEANDAEKAVLDSKQAG